MTDDITLEDIFGPAPIDRPDHLDFWHLSQTVLKFDGRSDDDGAAMAKMMLAGEYGDTRSVAYMAWQRCLRLSKTMGMPDPVAKVFMPLWIEGYFIGAEFQTQERKVKIAEFKRLAKIANDMADCDSNDDEIGAMADALALAEELLA